MKEIEARIADLQQRAWWMPWVRAATFLSFAVVTILGFSKDRFPGWWAVAMVLFAAFVWAVRTHRRFLAEQKDAELLLDINRLGLQRLRNQWTEFPRRGERYREDEHAYVKDLDVFGKGSLFQLLNTTATRFGEDTLAEWLKERADKEEILRRQDIVADLRERLSFRQGLERERLRFEEEEQSIDPLPFLEWAESDPVLLPSKALLLATHGLAVWTVVALVAYMWLPVPWYLWLTPLLLNLVLAGRTSGWVMPVLMKVHAREKVFALYSHLFERIAAEESTGGLKTLQEKFRGDHDAPHVEMKRLQFIVELTDVRFSPMLHFPLNLVLLWDLHCLFLLERWQRRVGRKVRFWFEVLGELEALAALANHAYENPENTVPEILEDESPVAYHATRLGHPLLDRKTRINNDVELHHDKALMLITGSNMSGKSTFLRTLGINAVLAYAGASVCADSLRLSRLQVASSMRIQDSLEAGISYFMAELYRIRRVLDLNEEEAPILFLLDEILHGTNTIERRKAALSVMQALVSNPNAIGVISTHDSDLTRASERFGERLFYTYFADQIVDGQMTFDYRLQQGVCPTSNALRLMKIVGIPIPEDILNDG
jgi:hypothetical protein